MTSPLRPQSRPRRPLRLRRPPSGLLRCVKLVLSGKNQLTYVLLAYPYHSRLDPGGKPSNTLNHTHKLTFQSQPTPTSTYTPPKPKPTSTYVAPTPEWTPEPSSAAPSSSKKPSSSKAQPSSSSVPAPSSSSAAPSSSVNLESGAASGLAATVASPSATAAPGAVNNFAVLNEAFIGLGALAAAAAVAE